MTQQFIKSQLNKLLKYSSLTCLEVLIASEKTIQLPEQWSLADRNKRKTYHLASHSKEDIHEKVSSFISFTTTSSISSKKYRTIWIFYNIIAVASCSVVIQLEVWRKANIRTEAVLYFAIFISLQKQTFSTSTMGSITQIPNLSHNKYKWYRRTQCSTLKVGSI